MAIESRETAEMEAQREEMETVLRSELFKRAPTMANLLRYLCEKLFAGEARQIKEYSVGVEVFHRGASFDQDSDSIVRVEANRLRKRLAAYYTGEGAEHRLRITIPLGQYVPEFTAASRIGEGIEVVAALPPAVAVSDHPKKAGVRWSQLSRRNQWRLAGAVGVLILISGFAWLLLRHRMQVPTAGGMNETTTPQTETQLGPPVGEEIRILAGSSRSLVDHAGKLWNADAWFEGGTAVRSSLEKIGRTQNPDFYRSSRQGAFKYNIPLKKGIYELHLQFAETVYGPESSGGDGEGSRLMTVRANGKMLLSRFDLVADAGASGTADVKVFTGIQPAADGMLHLEFTGEAGRQAILSAIEILPGFRGHIRPVRVLTRETPYYSNDSHWWSPDNYFAGGQLATYTSEVKGTDDAELYESERWGNFSYAIPVTQGRYTVTLYFAVRHGDWDQSSSDGEGNAVAHIFDVYCNGSVLLKNFNLAQEVRQGDVAMRRFAGLEANAQGKLLLSFVPVNGYATVTGIEVLPE
ncbi:MAG: malectin domain-containing carbohydrate-binding protein [Terracidiphilus sp.]